MDTPAVTTMADITTAMVTGLTSMASEALSGIAKVVPVLVPVLGGIILIGVLIRTTKKFTGR